MGHMEAIGFQVRDDTILSMMSQDAVKTSEIEGERLNYDQVRSSLARKLGMEHYSLAPVDRNVEGIVDILIDATRNYHQPLTAERIFGWHSLLFPTGWSGMRRIEVGGWRTDRMGPMQVVSGPIGRERVHYEAPAAARVGDDMRAFLEWFNGAAPLDGVLRAALAHLWFVTVHPLEDGNGRIARAIADMALARSEESPRRFYSMSAQIREERDQYYRILEVSQRGSLDVTLWMEWFLDCLDRAILAAQNALAGTLDKARLWDRINQHSINPRQRMMINRLIDGFQGKLNTSKWATIAKCSQDTALRDIAELIEIGVLVKSDAGGRSTSYTLALGRE